MHASTSAYITEETPKEILKGLLTFTYLIAENRKSFPSGIRDSTDGGPMELIDNIISRAVQ